MPSDEREELDDMLGELSDIMAKAQRAVRAGDDVTAKECLERAHTMLQAAEDDLGDLEEEEG